nr:MAG TPA: hypothetical protein [Caudoviricetes sp.]
MYLTGLPAPLSGNADVSQGRLFYCSRSVLSNSVLSKNNSCTEMPYRLAIFRLIRSLGVLSPRSYIL